MKRSSVASEASTSSSSCVSQSKFTKNLLMKGSLELTTTCDEQKRNISIHVKRCKNLMKINESNQIHAYVKCALTFLKSSSSQNVYQRTAVHKNSSSPVFDHRFNFELNDPEDYTKFLQIAVWHRNKNLKRSEFLGCLTIPVQDVLDHNIEGTFLLQSQSSLTKPMALVRDVPSDDHNEANNLLLKYLELNPADPNSLGRTPLTISRVIQRQSNANFGFEISWSKPPRINSICNEQLKSGVRKGDYLVFIDEINVVSMPKKDVIELIKKQGEFLKLEIFRPTEKLSSNEIIEKLAAQSTPIANKNVSSLSHESRSILLPASNLMETPKSHKSCHFKQPKVYFQPSVGKGIFV
ncbi:hypothetical protein PVAND_010701 [Polypedilum vanderplanki]|uniref:Uncharacterized protein n=1 Tax=Polypedilum vanderplanki TaxID=319348 RepID=A0A9J6CGD9_POLVA|nr:hypothetical protein PVAND_010701 [Polypedilum vanderplanki]